MRRVKFGLLVFASILFVNVACATTLDGYGVDYTVKDTFVSAQNKFALTNVTAAHNEFRQVIDSASSKDFYLLNYAIYLAECGFFDLSDEIFSKVDDYDISQNYIREIKSFYYPAKRMDLNDLIYLAEAYSNIRYNNYAQETVLDIINNRGLSLGANDYVYYIQALGYFETKDFAQAKNYISLAISQNPNNINYKILETKILLELNEVKKAKKLLEEIKKQEFVIQEFREKVLALEQYVLYKAGKVSLPKDYYLASYYFYEGKNAVAQRVLLNAITPHNKKINGEIYALLAKLNLSNDLKKAVEYSLKANKTKVESYSCYYALGMDRYNEGKYKQALRMFNKAKSLEKDGVTSLNMISRVYYEQGKYKQAKKSLQTALKKKPDNYEALYYLALLDKENAEGLLKKSLSYNSKYVQAYCALADIYINRENFVLAKQYLNNVKYIDETNFRYYYYLSRLELQQGNYELSEKYKELCASLEPNYRDIINKEHNEE